MKKFILIFCPLDSQKNEHINGICHYQRIISHGGVVKNPLANAGDTRGEGSIPGSGGSLEIGNGYPHRYSCLKNSMEKGAWRATAHEVSKSQI